jgi:hypothetical protein
MFIHRNNRNQERDMSSRVYWSWHGLSQTTSMKVATSFMSYLCMSSHNAACEQPKPGSPCGLGIRCYIVINGSASMTVGCPCSTMLLLACTITAHKLTIARLPARFACASWRTWWASSQGHLAAPSTATLLHVYSCTTYYDIRLSQP